MNIDVALAIDLSTHQKAQALLLELSVIAGNGNSSPLDKQFLGLLADHANSSLSYPELRIAHKQWLYSRGFQGQNQLQEDWRYERTLNFTELLSILNEKECLISNKVTDIIHFFNQQLNDSIILSSQQPQIIATQLHLIEEVFHLFDEESSYFLDSDQTYLLFSALAAFDANATPQTEINLHTIMGNKMKSSNIFEGKLTMRGFKKEILSSQRNLEILQTKNLMKYLHNFLNLSKKYLDSSILSKSIYFSLQLSSSQKRCWLLQIQDGSDGQLQTYVELINQSAAKKFSRKAFKSFLLQKPHARVIYLFLLSNFEALRYYFILLNRYDHNHIGEELANLFSQSYSQQSALLTFTPSITELFTVFSIVYCSIMEGTIECLNKLISPSNQSFVFNQKMPKQIIKNINSPEHYIPLCVSPPPSLLSKNINNSQTIESDQFIVDNVNNNKNNNMDRSSQEHSPLIVEENKEALQNEDRNSLPIYSSSQPKDLPAVNQPINDEMSNLFSEQKNNNINVSNNNEVIELPPQNKRKLFPSFYSPIEQELKTISELTHSNSNTDSNYQTRQQTSPIFSQLYPQSQQHNQIPNEILIQTLKFTRQPLQMRPLQLKSTPQRNNQKNVNELNEQQDRTITNKVKKSSSLNYHSYTEQKLRLENTYPPKPNLSYQQQQQS